VSVSTRNRASVVGLGKLGAPFAVSLAARGHSVIGVDVNPEVRRSFAEGKAPVSEPGLSELMPKAAARLQVTEDLRQAVRETDFTFIVVATPSTPEGGFSLKYVLSAARDIGDALREKKGHHVVVVTSTVLPGDTEHHILPELERASGKRCGVEFSLCYNPEFIALGSVLRDLANPDFILIGESDPRGGDALESFYASLCDNSPPVARMNWINAEVAKIAVNTFVTTKITFANMLARICERLPGADVDIVTSALGLDARIGKKYLRGGLSYGGPCFPRDNVALSHLALKVGSSAGLAQATDKFNREQVSGLASRVLAWLGGRGSVGILGLTYKPETNVVEESPGLALAEKLAEMRIDVTVYDPSGTAAAGALLGDKVRFAGSAEQCVRNRSLVLITTPWKEFRRLKPEWFDVGTSRAVLVDCWRLLDPAAFADRVEYVVLGLGPGGKYAGTVPRSPGAPPSADAR